MRYESYFIHVRYEAPLHSWTGFRKATRRPHPRGHGCHYFECYKITWKLRLLRAYARGAGAATESAAAESLSAVTLRRQNVG